MKPILSVGRLDSKGWAKTPEEILHAVMQNYASSGYSGSTIYAGKIKSLSWRRKQDGDNPEHLCNGITNDLTELYTPFFPEELTIEVTPELKDTTSVYSVNISVTAKHDGKLYYLKDTQTNSEY